jgi:hypothetical protein
VTEAVRLLHGGYLGPCDPRRRAITMSSGRWLAVGSALFGAGVLLVVGWLVYVSSNHTSFWSWEGTLGVALSAIGALMLVIGFVMPKDESSVHLVQRGGANSVNIQAGRDINLPRDGQSGE